MQVEVREAQLSGAVVPRIDVRRDMKRGASAGRCDVTFQDAEQPRMSSGRNADSDASMLN